ncbi:hypothetical protein [Abyssalbus ytuae]|uniref:Lipoprotein n=1 Tax=Abyssalbus ytuae TaxID=2926907 RepID=A0A9E6ZPK1_9FLAO|nr:hypothetical protein [Abyssalbus ytuae]UOB18544.1 hypothetical protein MQE35_04465 [Abyssalbus ytuae]
MKKIYLLVLCLVVTLTSCQFSENIYINDDGTGKMSFVFDGSELMKMGGDAMAKEGKEEVIDSTIVFKDFFKEKKDSIAKLPKEEQEALKSLEKFTMHMLMNPQEQQMKFDLFTEFNNVNELQDMMAAMNKANSLKKENQSADNPFSSFGNGGGTKMEYTFKKGVFKRKAIIVDKELHQQAMDSLGEAEMMLSSSSYVLNYHFPKPVKSVSNENAMFSADRKSFKIEVSFMDYLKDPEMLNLEVKLED